MENKKFKKFEYFEGQKDLSQYQIEDVWKNIEELGSCIQLLTDVFGFSYSIGTKGDKDNKTFYVVVKKKGELPFFGTDELPFFK